MSTSWFPNTPASVDENLNVSAPKINSNFNTIGNAFDTDHQALGSTLDVGQHTQSTYITQDTPPLPDPNNIRLFSSLVNAIPQLFYQYGGGGPYTTPFQLTNVAAKTSITTPVYSQGEVSLFINGIIVKIGQITWPASPGAGVTISYGANTTAPTSTPFPNEVFFLSVSPASLPIPYSYNAPTLAGFNFTSSGPGTYSYIAVGN